MWMTRWPLSRHAIRVGIPIGFPLGGHTTKTKVAEALEAVARGAQVLDMVMNVSRLKSGDLSMCERTLLKWCMRHQVSNTRSYLKPVI
jgi:Deoxyribose-phosphate aldolase